MKKIFYYSFILILFTGFVFKVNAQKNTRDSVNEKPPEIEKIETKPSNFGIDTIAPPDDDFTKDIILYLERTHALNLGKQFAEILTGKNNELTDFQKEYYRRVLSSFTNGEGKKLFTYQFVKIYRAKFTHEEIKQILAFYQTPVGLKTIDLMPVLLKEGAEAGGKIGKYLSQKIYEDMANEQEKK
jgi:hypothetical protein